MARRNVLTQVQALGEEALGKLAQNPAATRVLQSAMELKDRVDDLGKRVRGLEGLEQRIDVLEKRLAKVERAAKSSTSKPSSSSKSKSSSSASKSAT